MEGKNLEKKSLNSFAIILRNILKLEKETEISDENNKKLERLKKKLKNFTGKSSNADNPKILNSIFISNEKIEEKNAYNYLKIIFPEYYENLFCY